MTVGLRDGHSAGGRGDYGDRWGRPMSIPCETLALFDGWGKSRFRGCGGDDVEASGLGVKRALVSGVSVFVILGAVKHCGGHFMKPRW
jgi:hypothetical protein